MAKITTRARDGVTIVDVVGGLVTGDGDPGLSDAVRQALDGGATRILLNLGGTDFLNSAGINVLASSHAAVSDRGGKLKLASVQPKVQEVLAIARLGTVFEIHGTEEEAVKSFA
ncbi:STAS domain-containing protein [Inquilinus sp. OTU3971]|uniref:STAS domain-containing protein n=1 Tax=Inquilinus sp. OTU3971 TaxID=3043855 RepID=UPI00313C4ABB